MLERYRRISCEVVRVYERPQRKRSVFAYNIREIREG
jgi:hypothetical protein